MSVYFEAQGITFDQVVADVKGGKIEGLRWDETSPGRNEDEVNVVQDQDYLWILRLDGEACGFKKWGENRVDEILSLLETFYRVQIVDEGELGIVHIG